MKFALHDDYDNIAKYLLEKGVYLYFNNSPGNEDRFGGFDELMETAYKYREKLVEKGLKCKIVWAIARDHEVGIEEWVN